jgi:hypothetical protein
LPGDFPEVVPRTIKLRYPFTFLDGKLTCQRWDLRFQGDWSIQTTHSLETPGDVFSNIRSHSALALHMTDRRLNSGRVRTFSGQETKGG